MSDRPFGPEAGDGHTGPPDPKQMAVLLRARVGARIRPVVTHLPADMVDVLIADIVRIKLKYDGAAALRETPSKGSSVVHCRA